MFSYASSFINYSTECTIVYNFAKPNSSRIFRHKVLLTLSRAKLSFYRKIDSSLGDQVEGSTAKVLTLNIVLKITKRQI
jgi:hypothetical protein